MLYQASPLEQIEQITILEQTRFLCHRGFAADVDKKDIPSACYNRTFWKPMNVAFRVGFLAHAEGYRFGLEWRMS